MTFQPGDVVLLPFPFRDRLAERARPAIVVSSVEYNCGGDVIVAAVTSHPPRSEFDVQLTAWAAANLKVESTVRTLLATVAQNRILHHVGRLAPAVWNVVNSKLEQALATT